MLPSSLLIARSRAGKIRPVYAPLDEQHRELAVQLIHGFQEHVGKRKADLMRSLEPLEERGFDYRLVRGLRTLLERNCVFEAQAYSEPSIARRVVFHEANKLPLVDTDERKQQILVRAAHKLGISHEQLEQSLWSDLDEELILTSFTPVEPTELIKRYNLSLTQTLLFKALTLEFTVSDNYQQIFRRIKYVGLMYSVEKSDGRFVVTVTGPMSLFKMTEKYGTAFAKLLPIIMRADQWSLKASIVAGERRSPRIVELSLESASVGGLLTSDTAEAQSEVFDSSIERAFARSFNSLRTGWTLTREPEPLLAGKFVMIPDFGFEKDGMKAYLEIVGFWTEDYLAKKFRKLKQLETQNLIVAVDKDLGYSSFKDLKGELILYHKKVPLKPVIDFLKRIEQVHIASQSEVLGHVEIKLHDDIVDISDLAQQFNTSTGVIRQILHVKPLDGYRMVGDMLISERKLNDIKSKLNKRNDDRLSTVLKLIEDEGVKSPHLILQALNYTVAWHGLDQDDALVKKMD